MIVLFMQTGLMYTTVLRSSMKDVSISYLLQLNGCSHFMNKVTAFEQNVRLGLEAHEGAKPLSIRIVKAAQRVAFPDLDHYEETAELALKSRHGFLDYLVKTCGVAAVFDIPFGRKAVPELVFMENNEDLEGSLRLIALWESMKEVTKPSVWRKNSSWTIDEMQAIERILSWTSI